MVNLCSNYGVENIVDYSDSETYESYPLLPLLVPPILPKNVLETSENKV